MERFFFNKYLTERYGAIGKQLIDTGFKPESVEWAIDAINISFAQKTAVNKISICTACKMSCANKVYGEGNIDSPIMIVGEG